VSILWQVLKTRVPISLALSTIVLIARHLCHGQSRPEPLVMIQKMLEKEHEAAFHKPAFSYISIERSDRTGGHEWTEKVVEVSEGKLRYLVLEDSKPLSLDKQRRENARLQAIAEAPEAFVRHERARESEEERAQQILDLLPRAFLFQDCGVQQGWEQISYRPNPSYVPQSYEERILHQMSGTILIDPHADRLHMLQGTLAEDVSFE